MQETGQSAFKCFKRFDKNFKPPPVAAEKKTYHAPNALQADNVDITHWLLDSGGSSHMIGNLNLFDHYQSSIDSKTIYIGNDKQFPIAHIGTITPKTLIDTVLLNNMLHVPMLKQNLLSISQFTIHYNCIFTFNGEA